MQDLIFILIVLVAFKALTIGSDFNFYRWAKEGKTYLRWYFDRRK